MLGESLPRYPKRLIEVDLPIARISAHARREKSIRHGHISTLHVWWARRPLAACRAVICAALWPDPADELCPPKFREDAFRILENLRKQVTEGGISPDQRAASEPVSRMKFPKDGSDYAGLRRTLLDFIAEFANWDLSTNKFFLEASRALTQSAHESLDGEKGTRPLVVDPFAGGGAIPLEALRVGADAFASDLNPIPVLINKITLNYIPRYSNSLADLVEKWGAWVKIQAKKELEDLYPTDPDGATPVAYLWARTISCQGPGCGAQLPLIGQTWISTKPGKRRAFTITKDEESRTIAIGVTKSPKDRDVMTPISRKSSATCPLCGYTTPAKRVREALAYDNGGSTSARLIAVVTTHPQQSGKDYRPAQSQDYLALAAASKRVRELERETLNGLPSIPHENAPPDGALGFRFQKYGIHKWRHLYTDRQIVSLTTLARIVTGKQLREAMNETGLKDEEMDAVLACLSLAVGRVNDLCSTLCRWLPSLEAVAASNGAQNKMPMILDFVEANPTGGSGGDWSGQIDWIVRVIKNLSDSNLVEGNVTRSAAQDACLPDDIASALVTDPPYYSAFGYSDLSEFFYPWIRRSAPPSILNYGEDYVPKSEEAISIGKTLSDGRGNKDDVTYLEAMRSAFETSRRIVRPDGIGVVVFANKSTAGWEAILEALVNAGWMVSASWPIDTERPNRQRAIGSAALQSSVHLVCRPREHSDGSLLTNITGDWRDVLNELPSKTREWLIRLSSEGVVGADAIFACLGPALEIFSRYSRVEKSSGEIVSLREYLEHVWAAVANEALSMIFKDADAAGLEPDARLTAMWLWTIGAATSPANGKEETVDEDASENEDEDAADKAEVPSGFTLEFDAARKIAQGLGVHLEKSISVVEVKGDKARLLPVVERTKYLFGKDAQGDSGSKKAPRKKKSQQQTLFAELAEAEATEDSGSGDMQPPQAGATVLDRVHQAMILFAAGRGEALKRFLVEEGIGKDARFWKLAQSLSALYPSGLEEKRWVDGVLARKKGLGL